MAAYLQTQHCIPEDRLARIFSDLYKIRIAPATLASLIAKKADSLRIFAALLHKLGSERTSPFPGRTYPTGSVTGMPRAV
ncbi:hypothetical protein [Tateyamaria sp.]|uniref:hypothetical protein n=1 Tax=Tateyamaria sp. TaxID=1929288 RepID=UPI003B2277DF